MHHRLLGLCLCLGLSVWVNDVRAQAIQKGAMVWYGEGAITRTSRLHSVPGVNLLSSAALNINPSFGVFLTQNFLIGAEFSFSASSSKANDKLDFRHSISSRLMGRYYFNAASNSVFKFFVGAKLAYGPLLLNTEISTASNTVDLELGGGMDVFLSSNMVLSHQLNYDIVTEGSREGYRNVGLQTSLYLYLPRQSKQAEKTWDKGPGKEAVMLGGSWGGIWWSKGDFSTTRSFKTFLFRVLPRMGYFVTDDILLGAGAGVSQSSFTSIIRFKLPSQGNQDMYDEIEDISKTTSILFSPYVRYYFGSPQQRWRWFGQTQLEFSRNITSSEKTKRYYYAKDIKLDLGFDLFLNTHASLDISIGYRWNKSDYTQNGSTGSTSYWIKNRSIELSFGYQYFLF